MPWQAELPFAGEKPLAEDETPRTIALGDRIVPYVVRRSSRRSIGLSIDHRGLRVGAPRRASFSEVESLIRKHAEWVTSKLDEWRSRRRPEPVRIIDGTRLPMLGQPFEIRLASGNNRIFWNDQAEHPVLTLLLRRADDAGKLLEKGLRARAQTHFSGRVAHFSALLGVASPTLSLSSARTRWGSCSLQTGIRLNWRLIHFPTHVIDYVVAHELAHLREMNHSRRFWLIVGKICPDYLAARTELNRLAADCPHW